MKRGVAILSVVLLALASTYCQLDESGLLECVTITVKVLQLSGRGASKDVPGRITYLLTSTNPALAGLEVEATYDPDAGQASEAIYADSWGTRTLLAQATSNCSQDPWIFTTTCSLVTADEIYKKMQSDMGVAPPISARFLCDPQHKQVAAAFADAKKKLYDSVHATPTPVPRTKGMAPPPLPIHPKPTSFTYGVAWLSGGRPPALKPNLQLSIPVSFKNSSTTPWSGAWGMNISYHWYDATGTTVLVFDGLRNALPDFVAPGETITWAGSLKAPASPGTYVLKWDLVHEGVTWFSTAGAPMFEIKNVVVSP